MPTFHVEEVSEARRFTNDFGEFVVYHVTGMDQGERKTVELKQKASTTPPARGLRLEGQIVPGRNGQVEFKKEQAAGGFRGGGGGGKSPEESNRIARMNSHSHALKYWELKHQADPTFRFASWGDYVKVVDLFFDDVQKAGEK